MIDIQRGDAPEALARGLRDPELRIELHARFLGKCYLTEQVIDASDMDVEHRDPKAGGGDDRWENLFPAAPKANLHRPRITPPGGWLSPGDGVEQRLRQQLVLNGNDCACSFRAVDPDDAPAKNTASELDRLHHRVVDKGLDWSRDLRHAILAHVGRIFEELQTYAFSDGSAKAASEDRLRLLLSRRAPFTALVRSKINPNLAHLFD